jgi:hypothetical protein
MIQSEISLRWENRSYMAEVLDRLKTSSETLIDSVETRDVVLSQEVKRLYEDAFCLFGDAFYLDSSDLSVNDLRVDFERKIWSCDEALNKLEAIKTKAISILTQEDLATLQSSAEFFQMGKELALAFRLFSEADSEKDDFIEKLRKYIKGLIYLNSSTLYNFRSFIQEFGVEEGIPRLLRQCIETFEAIQSESRKVVDYISSRGGLSLQTNADAMFYLSQIESIFNYTHQDIDCISRGENSIGLIIDSFDNEQIVINPESAEGKAIRRIRSPITDDEWEVSYKPGDTINISEIRNRLKQRVNG